MSTDVPEKLSAIVDEIDAQGSANLARLTVSTPWFGHEGRLSAFGLWIAKRSAGRKGKTKAAAGALMDEARALLGTTATREGFLRAVEPSAARHLHGRARDFQNEFQHQQRGPVRVIHCRPLHLVEQGLALYLGAAASPTEGSTLATEFCRHPDSRYGNRLNGPGRTKIMEIVRFMSNHEAIEEADGR